MGEGCHGHGAWQQFVGWLNTGIHNVDFWWDFNFKPKRGNFNGSDGSNFGSFGAGSSFAGIWTSWSSNNNSSGGGGSAGFKDFFSDGIFGIKNVKKSYDDVCSASTSNANTPFLFAMDNLRQVATNDAQFENAFAQTLDYYYQLKSRGQNVTFAQVMKDYVINPAKGISAPMALTPQLPTLSSNPSFKSKIRSIMQQATSQYSQCVDTYGLQASTNNSPIEIPNDEACSCLGDFSVEDALNDMQSTINAVRIQDLKEKYPGLSNEIDDFIKYGMTVEEIKDLFSSYDSSKHNVAENKNNGPVMSANIGVCPSSFSFRPSGTSNVVTGLQNLNLSFSSNGIVQPINYGFFTFTIPNDMCDGQTNPGCYAVLLSNVISRAYDKVMCRIQGTCIDGTHTAIDINNPQQIWAAFGMEIYKESKLMHPVHNSGRSISINNTSYKFDNVNYNPPTTSTGCK